MPGDKMKSFFDKDKNKTSPASQQPMREFPAAMPGQLEAIASQLNAGYGTPAPDYLAHLQGLYNPSFSKTPPGTGPGTDPAPTNPFQSWLNGIFGGMGGDWGDWSPPDGRSGFMIGGGPNSVQGVTSYDLRSRGSAD